MALKRGPVVYCLEEVDNGLAPQRLSLPADASLTSRFVPDLLGGAMVIEGMALATDIEGWGDMLYATTAPRLVPRKFTAIPYHLWANRDAGAMQVWVREARANG